MTTADSFFGGGPQLSWAITNQDGTWHNDDSLLNVIRGGTIVREPEVVQATKMGSGEPLYWDEAKTQPKMQMVITLRCDGSYTLPNGTRVRDERTGPTDNGDRRLYVNGKEMREAIKTAFTTAGAEGLRVGSQLFVAWVGTRPSKQKGFGPARLYTALYLPGAVTIPDRQNPTGQNPFASGAPQSPSGQVQQPTAAAPPPVQQAPPNNPFGGPSQVQQTAAVAQASSNPFA